MVENDYGAGFHVWSQKSNAYNLYIVGKEILSGFNIILRTRAQKWTCFELLIENRKDMFLKL